MFVQDYTSPAVSEARGYTGHGLLSLIGTGNVRLLRLWFAEMLTTQANNAPFLLRGQSSSTGKVNQTITTPVGQKLV